MRNGWNPFCVYALQICLRIVVLFQSTWPTTVKRTFAFRVSSLMMTVLTTYVLLRNTVMIGCKSSFTDRTHVSTSELQRVIAVHMERRSRRTKASAEHFTIVIPNKAVTSLHIIFAFGFRWTLNTSCYRTIAHLIHQFNHH